MTDSNARAQKAEPTDSSRTDTADHLRGAARRIRFVLGAGGVEGAAADELTHALESLLRGAFEANLDVEGRVAGTDRDAGLQAAIDALEAVDWSAVDGVSAAEAAAFVARLDDADIEAGAPTDSGGAAEPQGRGVDLGDARVDTGPTPRAADIVEAAWRGDLAGADGGESR